MGRVGSGRVGLGQVTKFFKLIGRVGCIVKNFLTICNLCIVLRLQQFEYSCGCGVSNLACAFLLIFNFMGD